MFSFPVFIQPLNTVPQAEDGLGIQAYETSLDTSYSNHIPAETELPKTP